jgi:hypothetical protein
LKHDLAAVSAAHPGKTVRLWAQDESRFGLHTVLRRRLTLPGLKPICPFEQLFESFWLCGAIEPNSGESFVLELPATDSDCLQAFLDRFAATHAQDPGEVHVLLMDLWRRAPSQGALLARAGGAGLSAGLLSRTQPHGALVA